MANTTKYYLEQIKLENELQDLLVKDKNVEVTYNGTVMTLAAALAAIAASNYAHFEKADAVPEVADAKENVLYLVMNPDTNHYDIYAKIAGETEGSATMERLDDTTVDLSGKLDKIVNPTAGNLVSVNTDGSVVDSGKKIGGATLAGTPDANTLATEAAVKAAIDGQPTATSTANGLMSAEDKARSDDSGVVWSGATAPAEMRNGDLFVRVVTTSEGV